ncbi:MAG TPA: hypothetical protein VFK05_21200 [Polyangiaceae bacterium]|nr:hypothetical protein [Polyangiaceae bacterium]
MVPSAFDDVVESVRAALNAKRSEVAERIASLDSALREYERALEFEIAESFASEHHLKQPARQQRAAEAALKLSRAVGNLPELAARAGSQPSGPPTEREPEESSERDAAASSKTRAHGGKLVIIGALSGREKSGALPAEVALDAEWIDTERDGVHAVGNLPQRIRQGRVSGVVILERIVSHKHTEPVIAAAREAKVPVAFAGQGGKASLARALVQLAEMRRERA